MTVRRFLDVSTAHVSEESRRQLSSGELEGAFVVYPHPHGCGWFLYIFPDERMDAAPRDLHAIRSYAIAERCAYVCLDRDGPLIDGLPIYEEWEVVADLTECPTCASPLDTGGEDGSAFCPICRRDW